MRKIFYISTSFSVISKFEAENVSCDVTLNEQLRVIALAASNIYNVNLCFTRHSLYPKLSSSWIALSPTIRFYCIYQCHLACEMWPFLTPIYSMQYLTMICNISSPPVQSLLSDPNPASPANAEASQLYERDRGYVRRLQTVICLNNTLRRWAEDCPCLCAYFISILLWWCDSRTGMIVRQLCIHHMLFIIQRIIRLMKQSLAVNGNGT